jgi:transcriptional regulator with XRE-family HTH domain
VRARRLSDEEAAPVELKLALVAAVKQARRTHGLSQTSLARRMRSSQSCVARIETDDPWISLDLIVRAFFATGATRRVRVPGHSELGEGILPDREESRGAGVVQPYFFARAAAPELCAHAFIGLRWNSISTRPHQLSCARPLDRER